MFLGGSWPLYEMKPEAAGTAYGDPPPLVTPPRWSCCTDHMVLGNDENAEGKNFVMWSQRGGWRPKNPFLKFNSFMERMAVSV